MGFIIPNVKYITVTADPGGAITVPTTTGSRVVYRNSWSSDITLSIGGDSITLSPDYAIDIIYDGTDFTYSPAYKNNAGFVLGGGADAGYLLDVNGTTRIGGNVGIGNAVSSLRSSLTIDRSGTTNASIDLQSDGSSVWWITAKAQGGDNYLAIGGTGGTEPSSGALNISSGNVLIGTPTDSGYKLDVNGTFRAIGNPSPTVQGYFENSAGQAAIRLVGNVTAWQLSSLATTGDFTLFNVSGGVPIKVENGAAANAFNIFSSNNIGMGVASDSGYKLDVNGTFAAQIGTTASGANVFQDSGTGQFLRSTSSLRYKTDIEDMEDEKAKALLNARPIWYRSLAENDPDDFSYYGLVAEELAEIDPRYVDFMEDGEGNQVPDGIYYDRLTVPMLKLIQLLHQEKQELTDTFYQYTVDQEERIKQLEQDKSDLQATFVSEIELLKARLTALEG